jgi:hypothetical protein
MREPGIDTRFPAGPLLFASGATALLWLTRANEVTLPQAVMAFLILYLPSHAFVQWKREQRAGIPIFSLVTFIYWQCFVLPLFWGDRSSLRWWGPRQALDERAVTEAMAVALVGIASLGLGARCGIAGRWIPPRVPDIPQGGARWNYLRIVLVLGTGLNLFETSTYWFGEAGRQVLVLFQAVVPSVIFAVLFREDLRGNSNAVDRILMAAFVGVRILVAFSSGTLGPALSAVVLALLVYIGERRRVPVVALSLAVLCVLFLQVGKPEFRQRFWHGQGEATRTERMQFWVRESSQVWFSALSKFDGDELRELLYESLARVSLLNQTANVLELTPSTVPHQGVHMYRYLASSVVPRFVWPDKPSVNEANQFYQVNYGITPEDRLEHVSVSVGFLTEGYISFGWWGVVPLMFAVGVLFDAVRSWFLLPRAGRLLPAIGMVLVVGFLPVESQMAVYLGGVVQQVALTILVVAPAVQWTNLRESPST